MNLGCIDKRNCKSITPQDHINICKFYKTLECKLWYLIHFLNAYFLNCISLNYSENIEGNNLCDMPCYTSTRKSLVYYLKLL